MQNLSPTVFSCGKRPSGEKPNSHFYKGIVPYGLETFTDPDSDSDPIPVVGS